MFKKILIANRGEIACRVAATAARLAIKTVAVYSDADAHAKHVQVCDEAVHVGGNAPKDSYLQWQRILEAAKTTGAEAVHPGYGFLSENDAFAQACADAGLVFIGPPPSAIRAMGLKAASKQLMEKAGVPLVPGYHGADQDPALLKQEAAKIGYPVLIKASAGGGGKGMRVVEQAAEFDAALASCKREAINSFGDDAVLIEKYVQRPRHIEIQVFGDQHGNYVYLFERDCSVQRRHQKVLEEAPAPGMTQALREAMGAAAVSAARAVDYVGAGTVEFIVETVAGAAPEGAGVGAFYFMEMNTRLQVEHPVTEAITGLDLVEWQLRVAGGEALPLRQDQLHIQGHALEARICAETPDKNFLPATGTLLHYALPDSVSFERGAVRVDSGVRQGDAISPYYDSMVAKLIVHGATRAEALARMDAALAQVHIVGLNTNVQFLRHVVGSASFAGANLDTALIPREAAALFNQEKVGVNLAVAAAVSWQLLQEQATAAAASADQWRDPWSARDGWKPFGVAARRFDFEFHGQAVNALLTYLHDGALHLVIHVLAKAGGESLVSADGVLQFESAVGAVGIRFNGQRQNMSIYKKSDIVHVFSALGATQLIAIDALTLRADGAAEGGRLTAPMPGKVVSFAVKVGDQVVQGQALAVMDAMKMEHTISAPQAGVVTELLFVPGEQVTEGAELLKLA